MYIFKPTLVGACAVMLSVSGCEELRAALDYEDKYDRMDSNYDDALAIAYITEAQFDAITGDVSYSGTFQMDGSNASDSFDVIGDAVLVLDFDTQMLDSATISNIVGIDENDDFSSYTGTIVVTVDNMSYSAISLTTDVTLVGNGDTIVANGLDSYNVYHGPNAEFIRTAGPYSHTRTINGEDATVYSPTYVLVRQ